MNRVEKKCLYAIKRFPYADVGLHELNGYLRFPNLEIVLGAIGNLKSKNLISDKEAPFHGFQLSGAGEEYIRKHKLVYLVTPYVSEIAVATVAGILAALICHWTGIS